MPANSTTRRLVFPVALLIVGALFGYSVDHALTMNVRAYEAGQVQMIREIADCTLADARAEKCFIPCASDADCLEKNGQEDH